MFSQDREQLRQFYYQTWNKYKKNQLLAPLERQIVACLLQHPEYHVIIEHPQQYQAQNFQENNPFLHLSLHIALQEQMSTDRPCGIKAIYQQIVRQTGNQHTAEHQMMQVLERSLSLFFQDNSITHERIYLSALQQLLMRK